MRCYFHPTTKNIGDTLTPVLLQHFAPKLKIERSEPHEMGKLVAVGSILEHVRDGDTLWGCGAMYKDDAVASAGSLRVLALRGPLTGKIIRACGGTDPEIYGDPGLLMPLIYHPPVKKRFKVGYIPHYVDRRHVAAKVKRNADMTVIDIFRPWREFIDRLLECEEVEASSLHAIALAEAYGIPARWAVYSDKVLGDGFKFRDYLAGTGREVQDPGDFPPIPDLSKIQEGLLKAMNELSPLGSLVPFKRGKYTNAERTLLRTWEKIGKPPLRTVCECAVGPYALTKGLRWHAERMLYIEPDPKMAMAARINYPWCELAQSAILDDEKTAVLKRMNGSSFISMSAWAPIFSGGMMRAANAEKLAVDGRRFDQIDDGRIDLLNLDCEGSEWFVLKHMVSRPKLIFIELYRKNTYHREILEWFEGNGYRVISDGYPNLIFIRISRHHEV